MDEISPPNVSDLFKRDQNLEGFKEAINRRYGVFKSCIRRMDVEGGFERFSLGHKIFGPQVSFCYGDT